jgi:anti-anti-sigma factor
MDTLHHDMTITAGESGRASVPGAEEVDASSADRLRPASLDAASQHGVQLDGELAGVTSTDSTGLRAIADASLAQEPSESGLVVCNVSRQVRRIPAISPVGRPLKDRQ